MHHEKVHLAGKVERHVRCLKEQVGVGTVAS